MMNALIQQAIAKNKKKKNGFTLIELMIVVAIVGVYPLLHCLNS